MKIIALLFLALMSSMAMASTKTVSSDTPACIEEEQIKTLVHYSSDVVAYKKALVSYILAGQCTVLMAGEVVNLEDVGFTGLTQVRKSGDIEKYWVVREFLSN